MDEEADRYGDRDANDQRELIPENVFRILRRDEEKYDRQQQEEFSEHNRNPKAYLSSWNSEGPLRIRFCAPEFQDRRKHEQIGQQKKYRRESKKRPEDLLHVLHPDVISDEQQ